MDPLAFATANRAVGAERGAAAIEVSLGGIELAAEGGEVVVAAAGGAFQLIVEGAQISSPAVIRLAPRQRLAIRPGARGAWCYVAVAGRFDVPPVLGSVATHTRAGLGGIAGRALAAGDALPVAEARGFEPAPASIEAPWLRPPGEAIRVLLGPQDDYFAPDQIEAFLRRRWTLSPHSDRMAYLLDGEPLRHARDFNVISDGIALGAIQVRGDGMPMVLMADRQPTGGYAKIATVIGADIGHLAQLRPGESCRFEAVSLDQAVASRRAAAELLARPINLTELRRTDLSSEYLLGLNLIGGITGGEV
jgi:biotin-dependent carboxylase-like uncharacterized protein